MAEMVESRRESTDLYVGVIRNEEKVEDGRRGDGSLADCIRSEKASTLC